MSVFPRLLGVGLLSASLSTLGNADVIDAHAFLEPSSVSQVSLADDGRVAWVRGGPAGDELRVADWTALGRSGVRVLGPVQGRLRSVRRVGEGWIAHERGASGDRLWRIDRRGEHPLVAVERSLKVLGGDRLGRLLVSHDERRAFEPDVYVVDLRGGRARLLERNPGRVYEWIADAEGTVRAAQRWSPAGRGVRYEILHRRSDRGPFRSLYAHDLTAPAVRPLGFTPDGLGLYVERQHHGGSLSLAVLDPVSGLFGPALIRSERGHVAGLRHGRSGVLDRVHVEGLTHRVLTPTGQERSGDAQRIDDLGQRFGASYVEALGQVEGARLWYATGPRLRGLYLAEDGSGGVRELARASILNVGAHAAVETFTFQARDGLTLDGYLTRRPSAAAAPTVVLVHGGPWSRDSQRYSGEAQFLAALGYAVIQLNFRGSRGVGHEVLAAGRRAWGRAMQDDLLDAIDHLAQAGSIDPSRVCLMGSSYGGYAALMGVLRDPPRYRCAVAFAPVTDLADHIRRYGRIGHRRAELEWRAMVGDPSAQRGADVLRSPLDRARGLERPVLLGVGALDRAVNPDQTARFVDAAPPAQLRWLRFDDEGHTLRGWGSRQRWYFAVEAFLGEHLGAAAAGRAP